MTPSSLLALRPDHPFRPPDWRWELARLRREGAVPRYLSAVADPAVNHAETIQNGFDAAASVGDASAALNAVGPDAALAASFWLHTGAPEQPSDPPPPPPGPPAQGGPPARRAAQPPAHDLSLERPALEAYVLAGKPLEKIGPAFGLTPAAVRWYETFWFDVRTRRRQEMWVASNVIGPLHEGPPAVILPRLVRAYGYYTGSTRLVKALVSSFDRGSAASAARDPANFFGRDARAAINMKAALAARMMPLTDRTYARVLEVHQEVADLELKAREAVGTASENTYKEAAAALFGRVRAEYGKVPTDLSAERMRQRPRLVEAVEEAG